MKKQQHKGSLERINKLTEQKVSLEKENKELSRTKSPMPGEFPTESESDQKLRAITQTIQQHLKDWQTNFPGKKRALDSLQELVKTPVIEYKLTDFLKWLEEDEERKLGKENWDEVVEFILQPPYAPPLYFQRYAENIGTCSSNEEMESRTDKVLWNWIQTLNKKKWIKSRSLRICSKK